MERLFLPGVFASAPVLAALQIDPKTIEVAQLPGFELVATGLAWPVLVEAGGSECSGVFVPLTPQLSYAFEACGCDQSSIRTETGDVLAYQRASEPFAGSLAHEPRFLAAIFSEILLVFGRETAASVWRRFAMVRVRASAVLSGEVGPSPKSVEGLQREKVYVDDLRLPYAHFFAMKEMELSFPKYDGSQSPLVNRAVMLGTDASIILPYDPARDLVLLVEQFRMGPFARGDKNPWMPEPIAGRIDEGETAEATARREAVEEAGLKLGALHKVHSGYASPGTTTEYFHVFVAEADLSMAGATTGGLPDEAEDIRSIVLSYSKFEEMLETGQLPVTPLALAGYWLKANRPRLLEVARLQH